jgi:hypothetical protein
MFGGATLGSLPFGGGHSGATPGTFRLFVAGQDVTELLAYAGYQVNQALGERGTAKATLRFANDPFVPEPDHRFTIKVDATTLFDGFVHNAVRRHLVEGNLASYVYDLDAVDWNGLLDRRLVNQTYVEQTAGAIVRDIITTVLAADGILAGTIEDGPVIAKAVFPLLTASEALRDLSDLTGYQWRVDEYKTLHFFNTSTFPAPFAIDATNAKFLHIARDRSLDQYANRVYVRAGHGITATQTERQKGDGEKTTFVMPFPLAEPPTISRQSPTGTVAQTVGVRQVDASKQWYWQKNSPEITADTTTPILATTEALIVTFKGLYPLLLQIDNPGEITLRQAAGGGTGLHELLHEDTSIDGEEVVEGFAQGLLRKRSALVDRLTFITRTDRLYPGHAVTLNVPSLGLSGTYLVTSVEFWQFVNALTREYQVECAPTEKYDGMVEYWQAQRRLKKPLGIRENEVVSFPVVDDEPLSLTDAVDASLVTSNGVGQWDGDTRWGSSQWG